MQSLSMDLFALGKIEGQQMNDVCKKVLRWSGWTACSWDELVEQQARIKRTVQKASEKEAMSGWGDETGPEHASMAAWCTFSAWYENLAEKWLSGAENSTSKFHSQSFPLLNQVSSEQRLSLEHSWPGRHETQTLTL